MPLQITPNTRSTGNLNITANQRARMSSIVSLDWNNVTGKPAIVNGFDDLIATGIVVLTDLGGSATTRTITAPAAGITISNGDGVAGNPTLALANDLAALEAMASTGLISRTASETYAQRTITGTANEITISNGDGVAGNPTASIPAALTFTGKTVTGGTFSGPGISGATITTSTYNGNTWTAGTGILTIAALKTLTANASLTLAGTDGKSLTLTTGLTVSGNDGTLAFGAASKTLSVNNSLTLAGTDATTMTFPATSATLARTDAANTFTGTQTIGTLVATTFNKVTITAPASAATLTLIDGTTLTGPAASGTAMTLGNTETVTGVKTFGSAGAVGRLKVAGTTSGTTVLDATAAASGTLTLPAATDTLVGKATTDTLTGKTFNSTDAGNVLQVGGVTVFKGQYPGETTTGSATAGNIGETANTTVLVGSAVSMTTTVAVTIASLSMPAGDLDVWIQAAFTGTATTVSGLRASLSATTNVEVTTAGNFSNLVNLGSAFTTFNPAFWVGPIRLSLSTPTTYYYVARGDFSGGTCTGYGMIRYRRAR